MSSMTNWMRQYATVLGDQGDAGPYQNLKAAADRLDAFEAAMSVLSAEAARPDVRLVHLKRCIAAQRQATQVSA